MMEVEDEMEVEVIFSQTGGYYWTTIIKALRAFMLDVHI